MIGTISREDLTTKINRGDDFLLVETLPEFIYKQGHLPGAINLPPSRVAELAPQRLKDKNAEIVVYCGSPT
jgi:rhodanese-related sulfurtransferase